jgi:hypothetical protein
MECLLGIFTPIVDFINENGEGITAVATLLLTFVTAGLVWTARQQFVTSRAQLRAYVSVEAGQISAVPGAVPRAQVNIKNYGQTPAYKFRLVGAMAGGPSFEGLPPPTGDPRAILGVLAPSATFQWFMNAPGVLTQEDYTKLASGLVTLFVYGEVTYEDAFGKPHYLRYRTMFGGAAGVGSNQLASCWEGNESD